MEYDWQGAGRRPSRNQGRVRSWQGGGVQQGKGFPQGPQEMVREKAGGQLGHWGENAFPKVESGITVALVEQRRKKTGS